MIVGVFRKWCIRPCNRSMSFSNDKRYPYIPTKFKHEYPGEGRGTNGGALGGGGGGTMSHVDFKKSQ